MYSCRGHRYPTKTGTRGSFTERGMGIVSRRALGGVSRMDGMPRMMYSRNPVVPHLFNPFVRPIQRETARVRTPAPKYCVYHFSALEFHDAYYEKRLPVICEDEFADPEVSRSRSCAAR